MVAVDLPLRKDHVEPSFIVFNRLIYFKYLFNDRIKLVQFKVLWGRRGKNKQIAFYLQEEKINFFFNNYMIKIWDQTIG